MSVSPQRVWELRKADVLSRLRTYRHHRPWVAVEAYPFRERECPLCIKCNARAARVRAMLPPGRVRLEPAKWYLFRLR